MLFIIYLTEMLRFIHMRKISKLLECSTDHTYSSLIRNKLINLIPNKQNLREYSNWRKVRSKILVKGPPNSKLHTMEKDQFDPIVWIDMEMTGLDVETDYILEIACTITNENLEKIVPADLNIVTHQEDKILDHMDEWCTKTHKKSGLTGECKSSKIDISRAEAILLDYLKQVPKKRCPLAGNSVYMDRLFLKKYMPAVDDYLHYRIIDVSSIKELASRWQPDIFHKAPKKNSTHRALPDIHESIAELKYYRQHIFQLNNETSK